MNFQACFLQKSKNKKTFDFFYCLRLKYKAAYNAQKVTLHRSASVTC